MTSTMMRAIKQVIVVVCWSDFSLRPILIFTHYFLSSFTFPSYMSFLVDDRQSRRLSRCVYNTILHI